MVNFEKKLINKLIILRYTMFWNNEYENRHYIVTKDTD